VASTLKGAKPAFSPSPSAPQPAQVAARAPLIDIAGEWKEPKQHYSDKDGLQLGLKQAGAKITGLGKISGISLAISGTIDGMSVKLKATPMEGLYSYPYSYLELDLTFAPPDEMRGQEIGYEGRKGGFIFSKEKFHVKDFRNLTLFNEEKMDPSLYANIGRS
jgi:hypothetical protein